VQARIEGVPVGAAAVGDGRGARLLGVALGLAGAGFGAPPFAYAGSLVGPVFGGATAAVARAAEAAVDRLAAAFALCGLFGVDFLHDGARLLLLEVNPRYTASMELMEAATGAPLLDLHLDGLAGRLPGGPPLWRRLLEGPVHGKGVVYAKRPARAPDTALWPGAGRRDVPRSGAALPAAAPVCSVFASARDVEATLAALRREAAAVRAALGPW
jgi:predicted ATP-grasp superfamily ATP-dependent carboligase